MKLSLLLIACVGCSGAADAGSCPSMPPGDATRIETSTVVADTCYPAAVGATGTAPGTFVACHVLSACAFSCGSRTWTWTGDAWSVVVDGGAGCSSTIRVVFAEVP